MSKVKMMKNSKTEGFLDAKEDTIGKVLLAVVGVLVAILLFVVLARNLLLKWNPDPLKAETIYEFSVRDSHGLKQSLKSYEGHPLVVLVVSDRCGPEDTYWRDLQGLYQKYEPEIGLRILAFPTADQINAKKNPEKKEEIEALPYISECIRKYDIKFDIFEKIKVNTSNAHPLWKWLKRDERDMRSNEILNHFTTFFIGKNGRVLHRFPPDEGVIVVENMINTFINTL